MKPQRRWIKKVLQDSANADIAMPWARQVEQDRKAA